MESKSNKRIFLIILDSVGVGAAPDAGEYGDLGANTLLHTAESVGSLNLPNLQRMGLGNIVEHLFKTQVPGVPALSRTIADFGAMQELSRGKDTTTGHWEIGGLLLQKSFHIFPPEYPSFPGELIAEFELRTGRKVIGNKAASGTEIIKELGERQMKTGEWIVYTSADSVFQIAAHEEIIPLQELYKACEIARELCNPLRVGRVIARPFVGSGRDNFIRTANRRDYSFPLPSETILDVLTRNGIPVTAVGKIEDIFAHSGITASFHTGSNRESQAKMMELIASVSSGLIIANFIDFDMLYGHRRDAAGYAKALEEVDAFIGNFIYRLGNKDILIITADHGNDPTFKGTDHTREYVPVLLCTEETIKKESGIFLGIRQGFYDVAQTIAAYFDLPAMPYGKSMLR
jgi:phosphopentomutase